jgi:hypothetical protein
LHFIIQLQYNFRFKTNVPAANPHCLTCFTIIYYQLAMREACKYVEEKLAVKVREYYLLNE